MAGAREVPMDREIRTQAALEAVTDAGEEQEDGLVARHVPQLARGRVPSSVGEMEQAEEAEELVHGCHPHSQRCE